MPTWFSAAQDPRVPKRHAPQSTEPHPLKRGVIVGRCYVCGHVAPRSLADDPGGVHNVPAVCEHCGKPTEPYRTTHDDCSAKAARETPLFWRKYFGIKDEAATVVIAQKERDPSGTGQPAHPRSAEVRQYLTQYTGSHSFLLDMQATVLGKTKWDRLTFRQVEAVCKFIDNEKERAARPQSGVDLTAFPVGRTYAAVHNDSGGVTFLIVDRPKPEHPKWGGWVFVKQQQGPSEVRMGSQRPGQTYTGQWPGLIQKVLVDIEEAVRLYGTELGVCGVCGKELTNDESRREGIGPVCAARLRKEEEEEVAA